MADGGEGEEEDEQERRNSSFDFVMIGSIHTKMAVLVGVSVSTPFLRSYSCACPYSSTLLQGPSGSLVGLTCWHSTDRYRMLTTFVPHTKTSGRRRMMAPVDITADGIKSTARIYQLHPFPAQKTKYLNSMHALSINTPHAPPSSPRSNITMKLSLLLSASTAIALAAAVPNDPARNACIPPLPPHH